MNRSTHTMTAVNMNSVNNKNDVSRGGGSAIKGIRSSVDPYADARVVGARGREICYGDKIFARLVLNGRIIVEFMMNRVSDMTEIFGELRGYCREYRGLARLYLRNMSRGWSVEKPLMLYPRRAGILTAGYPTT